MEISQIQKISVLLRSLNTGKVEALMKLLSKQNVLNDFQDTNYF